MWLEVAGPIAGLNEPGVPATLTEYARYTIEDRDRAKVPALVEEAGSKVCGVVYLDVQESVIRALDNFEDIERYPQYERRTVSVQLETGEIIDAETYVAGAQARQSLAGPWDPEAFEAEDLQYYLEMVVPRYTSGDRSR